MSSSRVGSRGFRPNAFRQTSALWDAVKMIILDLPGAIFAPPKSHWQNRLYVNGSWPRGRNERLEHLPRTNAMCMKDTDEKGCDVTVGCEWMHA